MEDLRKTTGTKSKIAVIAVCIIVFAALATFVKTGTSSELDDSVRVWAYGIRSEALTPVMLVITYMANWKVIVGLIAVLLVVPGTRKRIGLPMAVTSAVSYALYKGLKAVFARPRPDALMWLVTEHGYSFPSGHTMNGLICYAMLIVLMRRVMKRRRLANVLTALLTALIILIGLSRIYVGVHYLTDILGGAAVGTACVLAALLIMDTVKAKTARI